MPAPPYLNVLLGAMGEYDKPRVGAAVTCPLAPGQVLQVPTGHVPVAALVDGTRRLVLVRTRDSKVLLFDELSGRLLRPAAVAARDPSPCPRHYSPTNTLRYCIGDCMGPLYDLYVVTAARAAQN
jgi:hypothetical protein